MIRDPASGALLLSASDLAGHLACAHLTQQARAIALGDRPRPRRRDDPHADLVRERGEAHERAQLAVLVDEADGDWVDLSPAEGAYPDSAAAHAAAADGTAAAMRDGRRLIFQAALFDGRWQGRADFLLRVDVPSALGAWSYVVADTKLARHVTPRTVHQVALYTRLVGSIQGLEHDHALVILGDHRRARVDLARVGALHRHLARRLEATLTDGPRDTYPEPAEHCGICRFGEECDARRRADDHLSLVAGAARAHRRRLVDAGVGTLGELAAGAGAPVHGVAAERLELLHHQARLQLNARTGTEPVRRHLAPLAERGYARLPDPTPGDVFFDLEGDPYAAEEGGLEFLWGWCDAAGDYRCAWAHDRAQERAALQAFIAAVQEARAAHPGMHVFHYAPHEASALRRLAMLHATGEDDVDDWLRSGVLVDLYAVVRQGLQVGEESYSLKRLESHHAFARSERTVRAGGGAIVAYERWRQTGDDGLLEALRGYNRDDCLSTRSLSAWLGGAMLPEAEREHGVRFADLRPDEAEEHDPPEWLADVVALQERLLAGLSDDPADDDADAAERRLMAHLLLYHHRENKPQWWRFFELGTMDEAELVEQRDAIGGLRLDASVAPVAEKQSSWWTYRYPAQEAKLGDRVRDPLTGFQPTAVRIEDGVVRIKRRTKDGPPEVRALIGGQPPEPKVLREALVEEARALLEGRSRPALRALLRRDPPDAGGRPLRPEVGALVDAALALDGSYLPVQGPPGTGKTYGGARMIVAALRAGRRVAITANSHAAVQNLLRAVEEHAADEGVGVHGAYKGEGYESPYGMAEELGNAAIDAGDHRLVAGTAWLLSRPALRDRFDLLFVDEAGQLALASALAAGTCARNVVLLGDPRQLPQVNQAAHPHGAGASVLEHALGGDDVVADGRGVLLDESWRMHPDVCAFVSELSYSRRLRSRPHCAGRRVDARGAIAGAGLRVVEVEHEGRSQDCPEEAAAIAAACRDLLDGGRFADGDASRPLVAGDIMVVAPYNLAVSCIAREVPEGVRVGTVDRFQGQEAPVVFFAMTCSSGEDVPRGIDFVFDRNRLNVAVSRAQCLAVLVHSPRLLEAECRTLEQMALVDGACRFLEMAAG